MPFTIDTKITCYLLPEDGTVAQQALLKNLLDPGATWIIAYAFTLPDMINELLAAHKKNVPLYLYLDYSQYSGDATEKPLVQQLVKAGIEVTVGTSPAGSQYICHTKGIVSDAAPGGSLWCWEGSMNFSLSAWKQVNTALVFSSSAWRDRSSRNSKGCATMPGPTSAAFR